MQEEIWKDVIGYEGLYQVSSLGRVKSLSYNKTGKEKILSPCRRMGYPSVILYKYGNKKHKTIHSLEAEAFIDKDYRLKGLVINHKNFNRDDNNLENLEIITARENTNLKHIPHSSKYTGVCWNKREQKWESRITYDGSQKYLGKFNTEEEASHYYQSALICINEGRIDDIKRSVKAKSSKHKGLCFVRNRNNWNVVIPINGKKTYLGSFKTENEAFNALSEYKNKYKIEF
jgi:hypothetical protein